MYTEEEASQIEAQNVIVTYFSRHLVALLIKYIAIDEDGKDVGNVQFYTGTCFIIVFRDVWHLVTAGHVLKVLDDALSRAQIRILSASLLDYFGPDAKVRTPVIFDFENEPVYYIDDQDFGLDLGIMLLRHYLCENLAANGIVPVDERNWTRQHQVNFHGHFLIGFPQEKTKQTDEPVPQGIRRSLFITPTIVGVRQLSPADIDDPPASKLPWFIGRAAGVENLRDIAGMSGGPIIGFKKGDGQGLYWIVALQSWWRNQTRIIFGCPVSVFMDQLGRWLDEPVHAR